MEILDSSTVKTLIERLERLQPDAAARWGKMNARQMVAHLNDSMALARGEKAASESITFLNRTVMRWGALHVPVRWPKGVATRPELDQQAGGAEPSEFAEGRRRLAADLEGFVRREFTFGRHPLMGELTEWEWMRWAYLHADHHFRQFGV